MKRAVALLIDHMLIGTVVVFGAIPFIVWMSMNGRAGTAIAVVIPAVWGLWICCFAVADYLFGGMTPGKRALGIRMTWAGGKPTLGAAFLHALFKWLLVSCWPLGGILYLVCGHRMPYDRLLGISYEEYGIGVPADGSGGSADGTGESADEIDTLTAAARRRTARRWIAAVSAVCILFFVAVFGLVTGVLRHISEKEYYEIGTEQVASVSAVLGRQRLNSYSSRGVGDNVEKRYQYVVKEGSEEAASGYVHYLTAREGFQNVDRGPDYAVLTKKTDGGDASVTVRVLSDDGHLVVELQYEKRAGGTD